MLLVSTPCLNKTSFTGFDVERPSLKRHNACASDWGGTIAWLTAIWYPEVVEKLIVGCGAHPDLYFRNMDADQKKKCGLFAPTFDVTPSPCAGA